MTPRSFFAYANISTKSKPYAKTDGLDSWKKRGSCDTVPLMDVEYFFFLSHVRKTYLFLGPMMKLAGIGFRLGSVSTSTPSLSSSLQHPHSWEKWRQPKALIPWLHDIYPTIYILPPPRPLCIHTVYHNIRSIFTLCEHNILMKYILLWGFLINEWQESITKV